MTAKARITAIDRFVKGLKEDNIYNDINACCVMAGWDSLAGALTPLKGAAPTNSGFLAADLDRGIGLKGNGSSKYLNSNRANNADGQNDNHNAVFVSHIGPGVLMASAGTATGLNWIDLTGTPAARFFSRSNSAFQQVSAELQTGLYAQSRAASSAFRYFCPQDANEKTATSQTPNSANQIVFAYTNDGVSFASFSTSTIPFYSIGSSLGSDPATGLAALDARVSTLMADLRAIEEVGFDRDALAYLRAVEEADNAFLETSVKVAVNNLVSGLKADGLWDAIGSTCLLCGPRTLAGALVPLKGDAPTSYGFVEGDFDRVGLTGDGTSYLDSNRAVDADEDSSHHISAFVETGSGVLGQYAIGAMSTSSTYTIAGGGMYSRSNTSNAALTSATLGIVGVSRSSPANFNWKRSGGATATSVTAATPANISVSHLVFAYNTNTATPSGFSTSALAFYSIGSSIDLAKLDSHVSAYVTAIGAAI